MTWTKTASGYTSGEFLLTTTRRTNWASGAVELSRRNSGIWTLARIDAEGIPRPVKLGTFAACKARAEEVVNA